MASPYSVSWEIAGGGSPPAPPGSSPARRKKRTRAVADSRCQVEGCGADLSAGKSYHFRHRVCEDHSKSPSVVVAGQTQRFCQQCSRFHDLGEFDEDKRSCRRRLAGHNQRRRKPAPNLTSSIHYPAQFTAASSYYYGGQLATGLAIDRPLSHFNSAKPTRIDGCDAFISQEAAAAPGLVMPFNSNPSMLSFHPASSGPCVRMPYGYYTEPVGQILPIQNGGFSEDGVDAGKLSSTSDSERALCLLSKGWNNVVTNNASSTNQGIGENGVVESATWCCFR